MVAYQRWDCAWRWSCRGGQWNSCGNCDGETRPITNETQLSPYPWMMRTLESVIAEMITPVLYLNITKMTDYRKDGHPSIFRQPEASRSNEMVQDCSHWCLPGVPDSWNELLYATLLTSSYGSRSNRWISVKNWSLLYKFPLIFMVTVCFQFSSFQLVFSNSLLANLLHAFGILLLIPASIWFV